MSVNPKSRQQVSVLLPAHDEAATVADIVRRALASTPDLLEILVIDDGSRDATAEEARRAGAQVHRFPRNRGKGAALRKGLELARGDVIVVLDADGQDRPEEIACLLGALEPEVGLVIGSRFLGAFEPGSITGLNKLGTLALRGVLNALWAVEITDPVAGFRAFRRDALRHCRFRARRYDVEIEMLLDLLAGGVRVVEVPVRRSTRRHGQSDLNALVDGARMLGRIVTRRISAGHGGAR